MIFILIAAAVAGYYFYSKDKAGIQPVKVSAAKLADIKRTVSAPVVVEAPITLALNFEASGKIKNIYVAEGEAVKKGDLLAELENDDLQTAFDQASAQASTARAGVDIAEQNQAIANSAVSIANSNLQKLRSGLTTDQLAITKAQLDQAAQAVEDAEANAAATKNLTEETEDQAELAVEAADDAVDAAEDNYELTKKLNKQYPTKVTIIDVQAAKAALDQAESALDATEQALETTKAQNEQALQLANAQVNAARGTYEVVLAQYNAQKALPRPEDLNIANQTVEQAEAQGKIAAAQLSTATDQLLIAEGQKQQASRQMTRTMLFSPTDGLIVQIANKEGELLGSSTGLGGTSSTSGAAGSLSALSLSSATSAAGGAFMVLIDLSNVDVIADVDETDIAKVKQGMQAEVNLDAFSDVVLKGKVSAISRTSKTSSTGGHVFETTVHVEKGTYDISQGMTGDTEILLEERTEIITVPFESVFNVGKAAFVFVMEDGKALKKQVELGISNDTEYQVLSGVSAGEQIIISGLEDLQDGQRVREDTSSTS